MWYRLGDQNANRTGSVITCFLLGSLTPRYLILQKGHTFLQEKKTLTRLQAVFVDASQ